MLSSKDLSDIKHIVQETFEEKIIEYHNKTLKDELRKQFKKELGPIKRDLKFIREALNAAVHHFDMEIIDIKKRLDLANI
ncbi:hypothetical protein A2716_00490 [candidate division WWE3 bacterium RIFCSPHIGHO2_01_FULL_40_23]|uniref:Uncharacterized protein n=1 Tax=candidate division WWE3 bacterium RIFCSPLOWO2_01_FULL_41_18 TaxID=1802625 RepID=A0A1F4VFI8_UNCKA|nr:MAG: hypothetical protein A2716_00490 [candidate division WWE3 bacterium RIFCSPHIGHO2_01_FULL_40_23]OGC55473.1 MAG: hypothetical protein A3A78_00760 [candidate division WWE3 bacterium RIFCSPLOWO2_01_FULL_41_18]